MGLKEILAKIPSAFHKITPSLLVGIDPSGDPAAVKTDSDGKLLATATTTQAGAGWTIEGDAVTVVTSAPTVDVWSLRSGGLTGTVVQTITVTYSDSNKTQIVSTLREVP